MDNPLISIIIPVYNGESTIERAINSALNQTYRNIEVLVIDDKSTDNTLEVISKIRDKRLRILKHSENKSGSAARNTGIRNAKGEYIAFLDDDDEALPNRIELQFNMLRIIGDRYKAVTSNYYIQNKSTWRLIKKNQNAQTIANVLIMKEGLGAMGSTLMIHKSLVNDVGYFDESFRRHQDIEYTIRVLRVTKIAVVNEPLVKIYGHPGAPSAEKILQVKEHFLNTFKNDIENFSIDIQKEIYARHWLQVSRFFALDGDIKNTFKYLLKSIRYSIVISDIIKFIPKETYILIPIYLIKGIIFGKRKWQK